MQKWYADDADKTDDRGSSFCLICVYPLFVRVIRVRYGEDSSQRGPFVIETLLLDEADLIDAEAESSGNQLARACHADTLILRFNQGEENLLAPRLRQKLFYLMLRHRSILLLGPEWADNTSSLPYRKCTTRSNSVRQNPVFFRFFM